MNLLPRYFILHVFLSNWNSNLYYFHKHYFRYRQLYTYALPLKSFLKKFVWLYALQNIVVGPTLGWCYKHICFVCSFHGQKRHWRHNPIENTREGVLLLQFFWTNAYPRKYAGPSRSPTKQQKTCLIKETRVRSLFNLGLNCLTLDTNGLWNNT